MSKIFINYRRDDSADYAGRLYDRLTNHFGHQHVFMDIDQIKPGEVFDQVIQEKLTTVQVAVVLIGKQWLNLADANGQRRLDDPDDWVRLEIAALLQRNIRVIPVLVGGAAMPKTAQLPECLAPLARRQALEITNHPRFRADTDKLIKALEEIMGMSASPSPPPPPESPKVPEKPSYSPFMAIVGVIGMVLIAGYWGLGERSPGIETNPIETKSIALPEPVTQQTTTVVAINSSQTDSTQVAVIEPEMVRIPPGKFLMGSPATDVASVDNERPQHEVTINYAFEISKYEITFDEYDAFANDTQRKLPSDEGWGRGKRPVINVSWQDAQAYVKWLADKTGKKYRLPTETEWEYAARAGKQTRYWWGDDIGKNNANCDGCSSQWDNKQTAPVGSFKSNPFGLNDTAGNVWEWTQDCWHESYTNAPADGSAWLEQNGGNCDRRVVRGGSWLNNPQLLRSAIRIWYDTVEAGINLGFRIARAL